jgi:hypothetical protein
MGRDPRVAQDNGGHCIHPATHIGWGLFDNFEAVELGQRNVETDEVRAVLALKCEGLVAIVSDDELVVLPQSTFFLKSAQDRGSRAHRRRFIGP